MRYVAARFHMNDREETYRIYVTDALYALTNRGLSLTKRYQEILHPAQEKPKDNRSVQEIVSQVWSGIKGGKE